jgi:hypothetical protein
MPKIPDNHRKVIALLRKGHNAAAVAEEVGLSRKRIFDLARRHTLPTNPIVKPNGRIEKQIVKASRILTIPEIGVAFRLSETRVKEIDRETKARL